MGRDKPSMNILESGAGAIMFPNRQIVGTTSRDGWRCEFGRDTGGGGHDAKLFA